MKERFLTWFERFSSSPKPWGKVRESGQMCPSLQRVPSASIPGWGHRVGRAEPLPCHPLPAPEKGPRHLPAPKPPTPAPASNDTGLAPTPASSHPALPTLGVWGHKQMGCPLWCPQDFSQSTGDRLSPWAFASCGDASPGLGTPGLIQPSLCCGASAAQGRVSQHPGPALLGSEVPWVPTQGPAHPCDAPTLPRSPYLGKSLLLGLPLPG